MMVREVTIFYLASTAVYFLLGTGSAVWAGFNMVTLLGCLMFYMRGRRVSKSDAKWVSLAYYVTGARVVYTVICVAWPPVFIYPANKILAVTLIFFIAINVYRNE